MHNIDLPPQAVELHRKKYYGDIDYILEKLANKERIFDYTPKKRIYFQEFRKLFQEYDILVALPNEIEKFKKKEAVLVTRHLGGNRGKRINAVFSKIFSYDAFACGEKICGHYLKKNCAQKENGATQANKTHEEEKVKNWNAWEYVKLLNVTVCPYCNADTIFATKITKDKKINIPIRSALDHYYPKSDFPFLAISLCNLVPACTRCNTNIKGGREFAENKPMIHPYMDNFHDGIRFCKKIKNSSGFFENNDGFELELKLKKSNDNGSLSEKAQNMADFFAIKEVYNTLFKREAAHVLRKAHLCTNAYFEKLESIGISREEIDFLLWGESLAPEEINRNRLSKMTIDLKNDEL